PDNILTKFGWIKFVVSASQGVEEGRDKAFGLPGPDNRTPSGVRCNASTASASSQAKGAKIEAITYMYETVKHFDNLLHEKHVYKMHNVKFSLHPGEFNFRHLNGHMELCLDQQTIVEPYTVPIQMVPFPKQILLNLDDIAELPNRTLVDIMAIVVHLDTIHRTMWCPFRKIVIMDARGYLHIIKVWGDLLNKNALRWALAKEDYGIIIGTMFRRFRRQ
ncbi:hypothetical protein ACJX0J_031942, partial [Zea mays]